MGKEFKPMQARKNGYYRIFHPVPTTMACGPAILIFRSMGSDIPFIVSPSGDFRGSYGPTTNGLVASAPKPK